MKPEAIDLKVITDIKELKAMMADQFMQREKGNAMVQEAVQNIQALQMRLEQVENDKAPKTSK